MTLLFRLGTREMAEIRWEAADDSIAAALAFLRARQADWKIAGRPAETAIAETRRLLEYIATTSARPAGRLRVAHNGTELRISIPYDGDMPPDTPDQSRPPDPVTEETDLDNEEAAVFAGLRTFIHSLKADRRDVTRRGGTMRVRLSYGL